MDIKAELELAWAAGFFDGEGGFYVQRHKSGNKSVQTSAKQNDVRTLVRFKNAVGVGNIGGPYQGNLAYHQKQYRWTAYGQNARIFINRISKYLSQQKLEQLERVLKEVDSVG